MFRKLPIHNSLEDMTCPLEGRISRTQNPGFTANVACVCRIIADCSQTVSPRATSDASKETNDGGVVLKAFAAPRLILEWQDIFTCSAVLWREKKKYTA